MNTKVKRYEGIELTVPANSTGRVAFNTIPQLRNQPGQTIIIKSINVFLDTVYAHSAVTSSVVGFPATELPKAVLVLYVNGEESIKYIPLAFLNHIDDGSNPYMEQIVEFDDLSNVDFDKSYVQFSAASAAFNYVIPFGIEYVRFVSENLSYNV